MKICTIALSASVAMAALAATSATAGDIARGEWARTVNGQIVTGYTNAAQDTWNNDAANRLNAQTGNLPEISAVYFLGSSSGNNGTASLTDGATFTLKGNVTKDCAFYSGTGNQTLDFGTIGIYANDTAGPALAFDMVDDAEVTIYTNLAGCNSANEVKLSKNDVRGLVNNSHDGYDTNVFQANLEYTVDATYTAGPRGQAIAASSQTLSIAANGDQAARQHGAWKSPMAIAVKIPVPSKSLVAGNYEGNLTVQIQAF